MFNPSILQSFFYFLIKLILFTNFATQIVTPWKMPALNMALIRRNTGDFWRDEKHGCAIHSVKNKYLKNQIKISWVFTAFPGLYQLLFLLFGGGAGFKPTRYLVLHVKQCSMKFGANQKMGCTELGGESIMQTWCPGSSLQKSLMSSNYLLTCSTQNQCFCFTDS